jgi:transcription elongation factor GreB
MMFFLVGCRRAHRPRFARRQIGTAATGFPGNQGKTRGRVGECRGRKPAAENPPMSKAFTKEVEAEDEEELDGASPLPLGTKNYMTPAGYAALKAELLQLLDEERPKIVETVSWAAKNGDRSENGDYLYGKKRLREIDRRTRFLTKRLERAEVVDPSVHAGSDQVFFGATVSYADAEGQERTVTIKGIDEVEHLRAEISWISPVARALLKARVGDEVRLQTPAGLQTLEILDVRYPLKT